MLLQYRAAAAAGLATQIVFGWIIVMVYEAFYVTTSRAQPMRLDQVVTFIWLGQAFLGNFPWNTDREFLAMVRDGSMAYELCRPMDLYAAWFARTLAWRTAPTLLRAVPMVCLAMPLFGMQPPASPGAAGLFAVSMILAFLLSSTITMVMNTTLFWTLDGRGINLLIGVLLISSGQEIPLPLLPGWLESVSMALPFRGLVDTPFRIYTGHIPAAAVWPHILHQAAWVALLLAGGRRLMETGRRRLVAQGG
jgi:ABC-2 type transport system permease protein